MADDPSPLWTAAVRVGRRVRRDRIARAGGVVVAAVVLVALLGPLVAPYDYAAMDVPNRLEAPSPAHPFGTDQYGRDVLSRVLVGGRIALTVALGVPALAMLVGVPVGLVAAYVGGRVDGALMRTMDALFAFPAVLLGLTLVAVFGRSLVNIVVALAVVFVPQFARVTRGSALTAVQQDHVEAARSYGASHRRVLVRHVFPFTLSALLVQATTTAALAVILESSLSFLGVGVPPPRPSWGTMLRTGKGLLGVAPWFSLFPGLAIVVTVLGFNLLGDGLRDVFDPRTRARR